MNRFTGGTFDPKKQGPIEIVFMGGKCNSVLLMY